MTKVLQCDREAAKAFFSYGRFGLAEAFARHREEAQAELMEALGAAQALATCCMASNCYSPEELAGMARATRPTFNTAIARAKGEAE